MSEETPKEQQKPTENTVPNDTSVTAVYGHIKIIDADTGEVILNKRT